MKEEDSHYFWAKRFSEQKEYIFNLYSRLDANDISPERFKEVLESAEAVLDMCYINSCNGYRFGGTVYL